MVASSQSQGGYSVYVDPATIRRQGDLVKVWSLFDYKTIQAAAGGAEGMFNLGVLYETGQGVAQDYAQARQWYEKAAAQGHAGAQNDLGGLYEFGHGVTRDYVWAYMWYHLAAAHPVGDEWRDQAAEHRDELAGLMTSAQIAEAKKRAREWKPKGK